MTKFNKTLLTCLLAGATLLPLTSVQAWWGPGWGGYPHPGYGWGTPYAASTAPQQQSSSQSADK